MSELNLHFLKSGLQTSIQDNGRIGYQEQGVPQGGALDKHAMHLANQIVGNSTNHPVLEITLIGPEILFDEEAHIAICGAVFHPTIDGQPLANDELIFVKSGSLLKFGQVELGCRAYLAIAGEWEVKHWLKSASAATVETDILTPDSRIKKGSKIRIQTTEKLPKKKITIHPTPVFSHILRVRVIPGPEFEQFSRLSIANFFGQGHRISQDANRMGYRLETQLTESDQMTEMISSGIIPGTIQVTSKGQPIILLADAQTTGGYPRIANIIAEDLDQLAQLKPGDEVWFSMIEPLRR